VRDRVHQRQVDRDQSQPEIDEAGKIKRKQVDAPDPGDIDDDHRLGRERRQAAGNMVIDELPEAVGVMLLDLMEQIDR